MRRTAAISLLVLLAVGTARSQEAPVPAREALQRMPIKEVTVFKDGHALVLHEGVMSVNDNGEVQLDRLPQPVMGTFWAYSPDPAVKPASVVAGKRKVAVPRTALNLREILEANSGARAAITEKNGETYDAKIVSIPRRPAENGSAAVEGEIILLETLEGLRAVKLDEIRDVTLRDRNERKVTREEERSVLTLKFDWGGRPAPKTVRVGMVYLQKGIRWIPSYRIRLDENGKAVAKLKATLLNEMADLEGVTAYFVVGVPSFSFKNVLDPISLQKHVAQLSRHFQEGSQTAYAFANDMSNMISSQRVSTRPLGAAGSEGTIDPKLMEGAQNEDLYTFEAKGLSLRKEECMALSLAESELDYKDAYVLEVPITPPRELRGNYNSRQEAEMARLYHDPKVMHKVRLTNGSDHPLTTAPAMIFKGTRLLGQGMMTYTSRGGESDIDITRAVNIRVVKSETETGRDLNAMQLGSTRFARIDMDGKIELTNFGGRDVEIEVYRYVLGEAKNAGQDGKVTKVHQMEEDRHFASGSRPYFWHYSWPWWWNRVNEISAVTWKAKVEAGKTADLNYSWSYYWN